MTDSSWATRPESVRIGRTQTTRDRCPGSGQAPRAGRCPACLQMAALHPSGLLRRHVRPAWMVERDARKEA